MKNIFIFISILFLIIYAFFSLNKSDHIIINNIENINIFRKETVSVLNFGDVMFDRGVRNIVENRGRDPFEYIKKDLDFISKYNVVVANLEGPIVEMDRSLCQQKAYNFQFASDTTDRLKSVGINMVNIANNHSYDCYNKGFESTKIYLQQARMDYIGDSDVDKSFVIKNINTKKVAFVGIDRTVSGTSIEKYYDLVKKLKSENDYVVVDIHWGTEYSLTETDTQTAVAHGLIDSGADVVFGHHPHVIEPVRIYKGKAIFYSLGNFVFDQNFGDTMTGLGAGVEFRDNKNTFTILPFKIKIFAPDFLKGDEKNKFCENFLKDIEHDGCEFILAKV